MNLRMTWRTKRSNTSHSIRPWRSSLWLARTCAVLGIVGRTFGALGRENINIIAIAQGSSECNISFVCKGRHEGSAGRYSSGIPAGCTGFARLPAGASVNPAAW